MIKLCWKQKDNGDVEEYYYEPRQKQVYILCVETYHSKMKKYTYLNIGVIGAGVCASIISSLNISLSNQFQIVSVILFFLAMSLLNKSVKQANKDKDKYILENCASSQSSIQEIHYLFNAGKKSAFISLIFVSLSFIILFMGIMIYITEKDLYSTILTFLGGTSTVIFLNLMQPIKRYKVHKMLRELIR